MNSISCLMCFQLIENENSTAKESHNEYSDYKERVFQCSSQLLSSKGQHSFNWTYSETNFAPFCSQCFRSSEKLCSMAENLKRLTEKLERNIHNFINKLLKSREVVLSRNAITDKETTREGDWYPSVVNENSSLPLDTETEDEIIVKEEAVTSCGEDDYDNEQDSAERVTSNGELSSDSERENSLVNCKSWKQVSEFPKLQLQVLLKRLQFDSEGKVIVPNGYQSNRRQVKRKAAIAAVAIVRKAIGLDDSKNVSNRNGNDKDGDESSDENASRKSDDFEEKTGKQAKRKKDKLKCVVCALEFNFAVELDEHSVDTGHLNERKFECPKCFKKFYRSRDLVFHRKVCYFKSKECADCGKVCETYHIYQKHRTTHSEQPKKKRKQVLRPNIKSTVFIYQEFKCVVCSEKFKNGKELDSHSEESGHKNERPLLCEVCSRKFYRKYDLKQHKMKHHRREETENHCTRCNKFFKNYMSYKLHMFTHSREKRFQCTYCAKLFSVHSVWLDHQNNHTGERPYSCDEDKCVAKFLNKKALLSHKRQHSVPDNVQCEICNLFYKNEKSLEFHMGIHNGKMKHDCDLCEKNFAMPKHLTAHKILFHDMESPFKCKHCETSFSYKMELNLHLVKVHNEKLTGAKEMAACEVCGKEYKDRSNLAKHRYTHTSVKVKKSQPEKGNFQCDECGKVYPFMRSLRGHKQACHSNTTVTCKVCDKVLKNPLNIYQHMKIHEENFFECETCGRGFTHKHSLKTHIQRIHERNGLQKKSFTKTPLAHPRPPAKFHSD